MVARSDDRTGWNGAGVGSVVVDSPSVAALTFTETGTWRPVAGAETRFHNVLRWRRVESGRIRLEHLRFGESRPVFLFDLALDATGSWRSVEPHVCGEDRYSADARVWEWGLHLRWEIAGPRKQAWIDYEYRASRLASSRAARLESRS
ncbi:MAG TPA: DUF6314 family protein [Candidatus Eisenbacteria bacterium]